MLNFMERSKRISYKDSELWKTSNKVAYIGYKLLVLTNF